MKEKLLVRSLFIGLLVFITYIMTVKATYNLLHIEEDCAYEVEADSEMYSYAIEPITIASIDSPSQVLSQTLDNIAPESFEVYSINAVHRIPHFGNACGNKFTSECSKSNISQYLHQNIELCSTPVCTDYSRNVVKFIIRKDGSMSNVKYVNSTGQTCSSCQKSIVNSIAKMQGWRPGYILEDPVDVMMEIPVSIMTSDYAIQ